MSSPFAHPIGCLLWDVDGTLTDTTSLIVDALDFIYRKHFGRTLPHDALRALIGTPLREQIRVFGDPEALGASSESLTEDFIARYEQQKARERILDPVVSVLIEGARRGLPTALVTSKNRVELGNTLPRLGIGNCVGFIVTADDVRNPKPNPEGLIKALQYFGTDPIAAVFIGDTVHDMRAARAAGVSGVAVTWGAGTRSVLEAEAPAVICDTPQQLCTALFADNMSLPI